MPLITEKLAGLYLASFILGAAGAWIMSRVATKIGLIDYPQARSSHCTPTPRGGGIGIFAAFLLSAIASGASPAFWLPISFLAILALLAEVIYLSPKFRLGLQFIIIAIFITATGYLPSMWHPFSALFWVIFLVGTANFYNFMDGIDGISGITGIIGFALLAGYLQMIKEQTMLSTVAITMSLACLGFLPFNLPKARVFMGDIGSILLGSVFGSLIYLASNSWMDIVIMSSFLFPCYADVSTTMLVRWKDRENLTQAHRRHIYQILVNEQGNPHWKVSVWFGLVQLIVGFSAILGMSYGNMTVILLLCCYFVIFVMISFYGRYRAIKLTNPNKNQLLQKIMPTITSE